MEGPGSSDRDLNQNVSTHVLCILFTHTGSAASYVRVAPRCSESSKSLMHQKQISVNLGYPSQEDRVNQQLCYLSFLSQMCLIKTEETRRGREQARQAETGQDCVCPRSRICPLSEREAGCLARSFSSKNALTHTCIRRIKSACKALLIVAK